MFYRWFDDVHAWEESDLAMANQIGECCTGVPLFMWYAEFFNRLGEELGKIVEISPLSTKNTELWEVWLKFDVADMKAIPPTVVVESEWGEF